MSAEPTRVDFDSTAGVIVAAYRWGPSGDPKAVVQITHGGGEHALRYAHLARALNDAGYVVYAQDHRGHGNTATSDNELGRLGDDGWAELVNDIDRLRLKARKEHPLDPAGADRPQHGLARRTAVPPRPQRRRRRHGAHRHRGARPPRAPC